MSIAPIRRSLIRLRDRLARFVTPARRWAAGFFLIAAGCVVVWIETDAADEWMPNAATAAVGIGLTITLVEWIIHREEERRMRPWSERVLSDLRSAVRSCGEALLIDYAGSHLRNAYKQPPTDYLAFFDFWLDEQPGANAATVPRDELRLTLVYSAGREFRDRLRALRAGDIAALSPDLVRAIDDCLHSVGLGFAILSLSEVWGRQRAESQQHGEECIVSGVREFAHVLLGHDPQRRITFADIALRGAQLHSKNVVEYSGRRFEGLDGAWGSVDRW